MEKKYYVYILANKPYGTLYVGITSDIERRMQQHKNDLPGSFTERYGIHRLVYYEIYDDPMSAIQREKQLKWWRREWKLQLIEEQNPDWEDLNDVL